MKLFNNLLIFALIFQCILCTCPYGWKNVSTTSKQEKCKTPDSYGRGVGYPWKFGDALNLDAARKRCEHDHPSLGCEQWGAIIYPKCKQGFQNSLCCMCEPDCPSDYAAHSVELGVSVAFCIKNI